MKVTTEVRHVGMGLMRVFARMGPGVVRQCSRCGGNGTHGNGMNRGRMTCETCKGYGCTPAHAPKALIRAWQVADAKLYNSGDRYDSALAHEISPYANRGRKDQERTAREWLWKKVA